MCQDVLFICGIPQANAKCMAEMLYVMLIGYLFGVAVPVISGYITIVVGVISQFYGGIPYLTIDNHNCTPSKGVAQSPI